LCWKRLEQEMRNKAGRARSEHSAWGLLVRASRRVLRAYSSSFFLVTRFLPPAERAEVEVIYGSVRYPDEIVDTFPMPEQQKLTLLDGWQEAYLEAVAQEGLRARIRAGAPWILAGFAEVVRRRGIPREHYVSFLGAMRRDVKPKPFATLEALIDEYVYGSAIVVGYFLTHVYGHAPGARLEDALACARELGIALQLTNFARDVFEDHCRGRLYLPLDMLAQEGLDPFNYLEERNEAALKRAIRSLAGKAESGYEIARKNLNVFAPRCRAAIGACVEVYQSLNRRILVGDAPVRHRVSVSSSEKFRVLPADKYWRVPLAYAGLL